MKNAEAFESLSGTAEQRAANALSYTNCSPPTLHWNHGEDVMGKLQGYKKDSFNRAKSISHPDEQLPISRKHW